MSDEKVMIEWTPEMLRRFKLAYGKALPKGKESTFEFDGNLFVVGYAGYLIDYLESRFRK